MTKRLILVRHGNTFKPEDTPVWIGARSDLPLVDKGIAQAQSLAAVLQKVFLVPTVLSAGPLQRTQQTADILAQALNISAEQRRVDRRLREIDYGLWEGKSTPEIIAAGGGAELAAWNKSSLFPTTPGWSPSEAQIIVDTCAILAEAETGTSLIVTSNGILRFFARAAVNADAFPDRKVLTGHICVMERDTGGIWQILQWNLPPDLFSPQVSS